VKSTLLNAGIACIVAAIAGGGFEAFGIKIPLLTSLKRQGLLATFGCVLVILAFAARNPLTTPTAQSRTSATPSETDSPGAPPSGYRFGGVQYQRLPGGCDAAPADRGCIRGAILSDNQAMANLSIELTNAVGQPSLKITSDSSGLFRFENLTPGFYQISADKGIGIMQSGVDVTAGQLTYISIQVHSR
jgi:hypothetical protein